MSKIGVEHAEQMLARFAEIGLDLVAIAQKLEDEGVQKFIDGFDNLLAALGRKGAAARFAPLGAR